MSADSWGVCPKCLKQAEEERRQKIESISEKYGEIPRDEWLTLYQQIPEKVNKDSYMSLREDYAIGIDDNGKFYVDYIARCEECESKFEYTETKSEALI